MTSQTDPFEPIGNERDHGGAGEVAGNVAALARLFPDAVVDGTVDLDVLADLLGQDAKRGGTQGFGLRWPGMDEARRLSAVPATQTLLPRPDESVDWDTTRNIVIEGDNLEVLRLLRRGYSATVDVIYIDPPYNTGNDFVYDDNYSTTRAEIETVAGQRDKNGVTEKGVASDLTSDRRSGASRHSKWLSMMYPRLLLAQHLLQEKGIAIVAIDDTEHARLKLLLDRIFGAENFIADVVWEGGRRGDAQFVSPTNDYMLIYAKDSGELSEVRWKEEKPGVESILEAGRDAWSNSSSDPHEASRIMKSWWANLPRDDARRASEHYARVDGEDGRPGVVFFGDNLSSPTPRPNLRYEILHPRTGRPVGMPHNGWRYERERMNSLIRSGRIRFGDDESTRPTFKRYLDETSSQSVVPNFYVDRRAASKRLADLVGSNVFDFPKDESVLSRWINLATQSDTDALILDFFAGSGSTAHAVMNLNADDGGSRRYIMVQLEEPVSKAGYSSIAEIMRTRIRGQVPG